MIPKNIVYTMSEILRIEEKRGFKANRAYIDSLKTYANWVVVLSNSVNKHFLNASMKAKLRDILEKLGRAREEVKRIIDENDNV